MLISFVNTILIWTDDEDQAGTYYINWVKIFI